MGIKVEAMVWIMAEDANAALGILTALVIVTPHVIIMPTTTTTPSANTGLATITARTTRDTLPPRIGIAVLLSIRLVNIFTRTRTTNTNNNIKTNTMIRPFPTSIPRNQVQSSTHSNRPILPLPLLTLIRVMLTPLRAMALVILVLVRVFTPSTHLVVR